MEKLETVSGVAAPLPMINVDTDMIIPKQFLKTIKRTGLGKHLFDEMRFDDDGNEIVDFVLNKQAYRQASILVTDDNFGCGSSREHAPWALKDFGIKVIVAPSFADIFYNNCFQNGMLPIALPREDVLEIMQIIDDTNLSQMHVSLPDQSVLVANKRYNFEIEDNRKKALLEGLDDIGQTLRQADVIAEFEKKIANKGWI